MSKSSWLPAAAAAAGMACCALWPSERSHADANVNEMPVRSGVDCHALDAPVKIDSVFERAVKSDATGLSVLSYRVSVRSSFEGKALASVGMQVLDPSYQVVEPLANSLSAAPLEAGSISKSVLTPASLRDGYYVLRTVASVSNGKEVETNAVDTFIHVRGGSTTQIDAAEFMKSAAPNGSVAGKAASAGGQP